MHRYTILSPIKIHGKIVSDGEIPVAEDLAEDLLRRGLIRRVSGDAASTQVETVPAVAKKPKKAK